MIYKNDIDNIKRKIKDGIRYNNTITKTNGKYFISNYFNLITFWPPTFTSFINIFSDAKSPK